MTQSNHTTSPNSSIASGFSDLINKLAENEQRTKAQIGKLQEKMKKTDERLDIVVEELQTSTMLILKLRKTLAEFVTEYE